MIPQNIVEITLYVLAFISGSIIGSFLNVCIYRLPRDLSIVKPRSFCPRCNAFIKWFDNIPIISYLLLRGRCRNCRARIPFRYLLVEIITACLFLFLYRQFSFSEEFFKFAFFFSLLIAVSFIDIEYHAIPASLCFTGIVAGIIFSIYETFVFIKTGERGMFPVVEAFKGLVFGFGFAYLFKFFGDIFLNIYLALKKQDSIEGEREALGLGDVDFMGMVGVFLGSVFVVTTFFIAPFIAVVYSIFAFLFKKSHLIPYLPYLSLAAFISFLWGERILSLLGIF